MNSSYSSIRSKLIYFFLTDAHFLVFFGTVLIHDYVIVSLHELFILFGYEPKRWPFTWIFIDHPSNELQKGLGIFITSIHCFIYALIVDLKANIKWSGGFNQCDAVKKNHAQGKDVGFLWIQFVCKLFSVDHHTYLWQIPQSSSGEKYYSSSILDYPSFTFR